MNQPPNEANIELTPSFEIVQDDADIISIHRAKESYLEALDAAVARHPANRTPGSMGLKAAQVRLTLVKE